MTITIDEDLIRSLFDIGVLICLFVLYLRTRWVRHDHDALSREVHEYQNKMFGWITRVNKRLGHTGDEVDPP